MIDRHDHGYERIIVTTVLSLALIFLPPLFSSGVRALSSSPPSVGGLCSYRDYPGEARIVSIKPNPDDPGTYEIKFSFHPKEQVQEDFASPQGKQWLLLQKDSASPGEAFMKKHSIRMYKRFPCTMKVITRGTCTPILFEFPSLNEGRVQ